jgi:hypothetical protein
MCASVLCEIVAAGKALSTRITLKRLLPRVKGAEMTTQVFKPFEPALAVGTYKILTIIVDNMIFAAAYGHWLVVTRCSVSVTSAW